jgi:ATP-dependent Clp protease ATP-binding subunit ClpA
MASTDEPLEANFLEARHNWNLEKLYTDLAAAKGKGLTPVEKKFLRGLLCGYSPAEIAAQVYQSGNSSAVRVYLSNGLYKYIQELLIQQGETGMPIKNWSRVTNLLEKAGYKLGFNQKPSLTDNVPEPSQNSIEVTQTVNNTVNKYQEWQEAIDIEAFYGRQEELTQLEQWIVKDNCRLIAIMGMGGIGKTSLAVKIAQQTQEHFELLIWRSLASAPPL